MNPNLFLADFSHVANAPEGINHLREMIYNLAVTGALSEQLQSEGDGHSLLRAIEAKKQALNAAGEFKRSPKLENLREAFNENLPKIPSSWAWSRLVEVGEISPKNEAEDATIAAFASMSAISEMHSSAVAAEDRPWGNIKKGYTHFADGDIVLAKITPCFENGKAAVMSNLTNGIGAGTTELHVVRPIAGVIEPGYIYVFLRSPYFKIVGEGHMTGTAGQKRLPTEYFATRPFPLPPLAEQKRIVAKVNELMALCDQLEAQQQERERRFPVLSRTCHTRFTEAPTPTHLNRIFDETGSVSPDDLRRSILTLAVQGKLIPQQPNDERSDHCLTRLGLHSTFKADDATETLPSSWIRVRFEDVALTAGGVTLGRNLVGRETVTLPYLRVANVKRGEIDTSVVKEVSIAADEVERYALRENDLLMTEGGDWDKVGRAAIWKGQIPVCLHQNHVFRSRFRSAEILPVWFERYFNSPIGRTYFESASKQTTNLASINMRQVKGCPVPFPPLAEQRRIVAKVDELMALVDQLEAQQKERDKLAEAFANACVASFTGTNQLERPAKMKAPRTELVSVVTLGKKPEPKAKAPLAQLLIQAKGKLPAKSLWQKSGLSIDAFYQQLKTELAQGWIVPPAEAVMKVLEED